MSARRWLWLVGLVLLAVGALPGATLHGQTVEFRRGSRGLPRADAALIRVLERAEYRVIARDTVIGPEEVLESDVVLVGSSLRVEGRVAGDLVGVESDIFARPGSRFEGTVAVLAGGFYGSGLAWLRRPPIDASLYDYRIVGADAGEYVVAGPGGRNVLRTPGVYGFLMPQYDRVSAVTVKWGVDLEGGGADWIPDASARVALRTAPTDLDGELQLRWPLSRHSLGVGGGRLVRSNDRWANGNLANSLYALMGARDTRLYYEARFVQADLRLNFGRFIRWTQDIVLSWERARSLTNRDPFSLASFRGGFQPNPPVVEADAASVGTKAFVDSEEPDGRSFHVEAGIERADRSFAGDLSFTVVSAAGRIDYPTVKAQRFILDARAQFPSSSGAPPQRWRALGGWGTLPTLRPTARFGDHLWWLALTYRVPLRRPLPVLGDPTPWIQYAAGNAWVDPDLRPPTVHNVGLGISLGWLAAAVFTDPSDDFETVLTVGFDRYR